MKSLLCAAIGLLGCYSDHAPLESHDGGVDAESRDRPTDCSRGLRLLRAEEMMGQTFHVAGASCASRWPEVTLDMPGRSTGSIIVLDATPTWATHLDLWPPGRSAYHCTIEDRATVLVSRSEGLEVALQCTDGVERRGMLRMYESCDGLSVEVTVASPEPVATRGEGWTGGCGAWIWSRR